MPTPLQGFVTPSLSDAANIATGFTTALNAVEKQVVMKFASAAARDAAITVPVTGMMVYLTDNNRLMVYGASSWRGVRTIRLAAVTLSATTTVAATETAALATLTVLDQGCAGYLQVFTNIYFTQTVASDQFSIQVKAAGTTFAASRHSDGGNQSAATSGEVAMAGGASVALTVTLIRQTGTGTASTVADGTLDTIRAIFVPDP